LILRGFPLTSNAKLPERPPSRRSGILLLFALGVLVLPALSARALEMREARLDLRSAFLPKGANDPEPRPLLEEMLFADLDGDKRKEIVVPGSDGLLRILKLTGDAARPALALWHVVDARIESDQAGSCYLTAAALDRDGRESLVIALPRGIYRLNLTGSPPTALFQLVSDRTFFDEGEREPAPRRVDFAADVTGDGVPELWIPERDGMAFWRRDAQGGWERMAMPPFTLNVRQSFGAAPPETNRFQPPLQRLGFSYSLNYPDLQVMDLDRAGRPELVAVTHRPGPAPTVRAECFPPAGEGRFAEAPTQVRTAPDDEGNQTFLDWNGDGFLDLLRVESNLDPVRPRTIVKVFVSPAAREHAFDRPTYRYTTHDPIGMVFFGDWNRDGLADLAWSQFDYSFGSTDDLVDILLGREIDVTLRFAFGRPGGLPGAPDQSLRLRIRNRCFSARYFPPVSMEGDFDGDGGADLLVRTQLDEGQIHLSANRGTRFVERPAATFPLGEGGPCLIVDLDGDGKSDVVAANPEKAEVRVCLSR